mmetsp:Transcript_20311/g.28025  ORF Transcript_20311/g.28025 Transcript_20311/m.28025 type:complete len:143 (+) Transcript_20311:357-785(+)
MQHGHLRGELPLEVFPPNLTQIYLYANQLTGHLDLLQLPPILEVLDVEKNHFHGTVDFSSLPTTLEELKLSSNSELEGAFDVDMHSPDLYYDFLQTNITVSDGCRIRELYFDVDEDDVDEYEDEDVDEDEDEEDMHVHDDLD